MRADTIGAAWLAVAQRILTEGVESRYDGLPVREISLVTLVVDHPGPADGDADSYATRLFDYEHSGRDQVAWVVDRLHRDPATRSAAITTFQPHTDTSYIPCVSLLDFWLPDGAVELASLQQHVAGQLARPAGRLLMIVKSAHVYESERTYLRDVLEAYR